MATMAEQKAIETMTPTCMESVNRITKLPVVESAYTTAYNIYDKIKDYNSTTQWLGGTAESVVNKGVEVGKPIAASVAQNLEGPIKKVDGVLCSGLDYVESKVPAVKLPPGEMYETTRDLVNKTVTPTVESAYNLVQPVVKSAMEKIDPMVQSAKGAVDPALGQAQALKDYGTQKLGEWWTGCGHARVAGAPECVECRKQNENNE